MSKNNLIGAMTPQRAEVARNKLLEVIPSPKSFDYKNAQHRDELRRAFCMGSNTPYSVIPDEFFDVKNYESSHYGINNYINVLDITDRLLSTFAYAPEISANGEPFIYASIKLGNRCEIPVRDNKGNIMWRQGDWDDRMEIVARYTAKPVIVLVGSIKVPAFVSGPHGFTFEYNTVGEQYSTYSKAYLPDTNQEKQFDRLISAREDGGVKTKLVSTLNPSHCFFLKNQLRIEALETKNKPKEIKEFITVRLNDAVPEKRDANGFLINAFIPATEKTYMIDYVKDTRGNLVLNIPVNTYGSMSESLRQLMGTGISVKNEDANDMFSVIERLANSNKPEDMIKLKELRSAMAMINSKDSVKPVVNNITQNNVEKLTEEPVEVLEPKTEFIPKEEPVNIVSVNAKLDESAYADYFNDVEVEPKKETKSRVKKATTKKTK